MKRLAQIGAGYLDAVVTHDEEMIKDFQSAFSSEQLLTALSEPICNLVVQLAQYQGCSATEVVDVLTCSYTQRNTIVEEPSWPTKPPSPSSAI